MEDLRKPISRSLAFTIIITVAVALIAVCLFNIKQYESILASSSGLTATLLDKVSSGPEPIEAPLNKDFVEAKNKKFPITDPKNNGNKGTGLIPSPIDKSHLKGIKFKKSDFANIKSGATGGGE